jgi:hypothetical protein
MELRMRVVCWNEEAAWFEQEFFLGGRSIALAYCKAEMRTRSGAISTDQLLKLSGHGAVRSPEVPAIVKLLEANEATLRLAQQEKAAEPATP